MSAELDGCLIVSGMPGAGKSTVARLVARALPRAAQLKADDMNELILSGRVPFMGEPYEEMVRQEELCNRNLAAVAANFIDFGFTAVVDQLIETRADLDFLVGLLTPRPVRHLVLAPTVDVCRHRNATRAADESWDFQGYDELDAQMRQEVGDVGWWFDTSDLTPEQTAELIVAEAADRATIPQ